MVLDNDGKFCVSATRESITQFYQVDQYFCEVGLKGDWKDYQIQIDESWKVVVCQD